MDWVYYGNPLDDTSIPADVRDEIKRSLSALRIGPPKTIKEGRMAGKTYMPIYTDNGTELTLPEDSGLSYSQDGQIVTLHLSVILLSDQLLWMRGAR